MRRDFCSGQHKRKRSRSRNAGPRIARILPPTRLVHCRRISRCWSLRRKRFPTGAEPANGGRPPAPVDVVLVWKFDRFARSVSHLLRALETLRSLGIEFCSFSEQLDTTTPAGKMVFTVPGAVAEVERSLITERVTAAIRNARAKGKRLGRPSARVSSMESGLYWQAALRCRRWLRSWALRRPRCGGEQKTWPVRPYQAVLTSRAN